jgi:hypothetical protein
VGWCASAGEAFLTQLFGGDIFGAKLTGGLPSVRPANLGQQSNIHVPGPDAAIYWLHHVYNNNIESRTRCDVDKKFCYTVEAEQSVPVWLPAA